MVLPRSPNRNDPGPVVDARNWPLDDETEPCAPLLGGEQPHAEELSLELLTLALSPRNGLELRRLGGESAPLDPRGRASVFVNVAVDEMRKNPTRRFEPPAQKIRHTAPARYGAAAILTPDWCAARASSRRSRGTANGV